MRSVLIVLLVANAVLFGVSQGWFGQPLSQRGREPERLSQEIRPEVIEVPRIAGLNAADDAAPATRPASPVAPVSPATPAAPAEPTAPAAPTPAVPGEPSPATTSLLAPGEARAIRVANSGAPTGAVQLAASPAAPTGNAALPAPAVDPASGATAVRTAATASPAATSNPRLACVEWGNFSDSELGVARRWSQEHLRGVALDTRRSDGKVTWMVLIPPQPTAAAAQATASQLSKRGIKDFFVIQEPGQYQHAVSLGVFSTEEAARRLADSLQTQGVRGARVVTRNSPTTRSWLVLRDLPARDRDTLQSARTLFAKQTVRDC